MNWALLVPDREGPDILSCIPSHIVSTFLGHLPNLVVPTNSSLHITNTHTYMYKHALSKHYTAVLNGNYVYALICKQNNEREGGRERGRTGRRDEGRSAHMHNMFSYLNSALFCF